LRRRSMKTPVLLGGAALTPSYVWDVCSETYQAPTVYCADAFDGLHAMSRIKEGNLEAFLSAAAAKRAAKPKAPPRKPLTEAPPIEIRRDIEIPQAPFLGTKVVTDISLDEVYPYLTEEVLF